MKRIFGSLLTVCMMAAVMTVGVLAAADTWDGTADTSWYNGTDTEFTITTAEQLAGLAELVDDGNTFEGKTVKLGNDIDLECKDENGELISFNPIGYGYDIVFKGTFDGQGNTIFNLYQNGWALGYYYSTEGGGLFASVVDATFKNLIIDSAEIVMECVDMGILVGYSYGNCSYENIQIKNSVISNYNRYTGGVAGEVNGTQTFTNVSVVNTIVSSLWGSYDTSVGGIIGGKYGAATVLMKDCYIACELDVFNDACSNYQWYAYRRAGMLIGNTEESGDHKAMAGFLTAENCTVIYGDWANYTYCEFEANGQGSYNDPDEWKFSRVQDGYGYDGFDLDHTHDVDETHNELLMFNQLYGGDQGVYGEPAHEGVTVHYAMDDAGWKSDETGHWYECEDCDEKVLFEEHTAGAWIVEEEATTAKDGFRYKKCTVCEEIVAEEDIEKLSSGVGAFQQDVYRLFAQRFDVDVNVTLVNEDGITEVDANKGGTVTTKSGKNFVLYDRNETFTITPDEGYRIVDVIYNGVSLGPVTEFTAKRVKDDGILEVIFEKIPEEPAETAEETTPAEETEVA